jgi:hypothetical protein
MATTIVNGIIDFVEVLENSTHDYQVTVIATDGSKSSLKSRDVFTVGDFVSYELEGAACINFAAFSNEHKIKLHAAYQSARTLYQRAQDAEQAFLLYDQEDDIRNQCADNKNTINGVSGGVAGFLGVPTVIAGLATANPFMMLAGAGMLSGTACAIKDTADNDAEKKLRKQRLQAKRQDAQEALAQSKRANEALDMLFSRFRKEALQSSVNA